MIITNDFYTTIQTLNLLGVILGIFGIFGGLAWIIYGVTLLKGWHYAMGFILTFLSGVAIIFAATEYYQAVESINHTLKQAGYTLVEGFPEEPGSTFVVEKDGDILYCLTGNTFEGGNTVRIECK